MLPMKWEWERKALILQNSVFNMPFTMSKLTWCSYEDVLFQAHEGVMRKMFESNRKEARGITLEEGGVENSDTALGGETPVRFDGTWSRLILESA